MANPELLEEQREETRLIIEELLEDGSDPDALYTIEHHFSADDFEALEKLAVEAFRLGYEVTEPEELEVEEGDTVICCDILSEGALKAELIDAQVENPHLLRMGAEHLPRSEFLQHVRQAVRHDGREGSWTQAVGRLPARHLAGG